MNTQRKLHEILLTLPSLVWLLAFFVVPAFIVFALSVRPSDALGGVGDGWTLDHLRTLGDENYRPIWWRTLWIGAVT